MQWAAEFAFMPLDFLIALYAALTYNWPDDSQKLPIHLGNLDPHLINGSLGPPESPPNGISRLDQFIHFFTAHECDQQTHRERPSPSCRNRPHLCYACDATQKQRKKPYSGKLVPRPPMLSDQNQILCGGSFSG